jgi:drug/metabolite transporter (DMT)-like permease
MRSYSPFRLSAVFLGAVTVPLVLVGSRQLADQSFHFGALVWIGFAFAVLGPLVTTNFLWFTAIDRVGPSRASLFANLQPFLAAIVALLVLNEKITALEVVGGLGIAAGIVLAPRRAQAPEPPAE